MSCCTKKHRFFCPTCKTVFNSASIPPAPAMPFEVVIIKHDEAEQSTGPQLGALGVAEVIEYTVDQVQDHDDQYDPTTTFILFPSTQSIPLSDDTLNIKKLVVFDCKWTKAVSLTDGRFKNLRHVKLSNPPTKSRYWRWHNNGAGMLSTIEATVCAVWEAAGDNKENVMNLLYLFGLQRAAIKQQCLADNSPFPWDDEYKDEKRRQTKQSGTERQKLQKVEARKESKEDRRKADKRHP